MPTNFPTSLDALTNPNASDPMTSPAHSGQHANANDAVEAIEAKVGVDGSAVTTSLDYLVKTPRAFSVGALLEGAPPANGFRMVWRAPFACTVTNVRSHFDTGTNIVVNARKNQTSAFLAVDFTNSTANAWGDGGSVQNTSIAIGDDIEIQLVSTSGAVTKANVQVDLTRTAPS